jgi:predicted secreted protein
MGWASGAAVYLIIWWLVIFMVLPWGHQPISGEEIEKGHASSAPRRPRIVLKLAVTTVIAAVLWIIVFAIIQSGVISFSDT